MIDLNGMRFGRFTVITQIDRPRGRSGRWWLCKCDCGATRKNSTHSLMHGIVVSCGCKHREITRLIGFKNRRHGKTGSPAHNCWKRIRQCCLNPDCHKYHLYGGRGITVCDRWRDSFEAFYADMGDPPTAQHSIDRKDNNGPYSPGNCRWATRKEQANNTRLNHFLPLNNQLKTISQWADVIGIHQDTLWARLHNGWSITKTLTTPLHGKITTAT